MKEALGRHEGLAGTALARQKLNTPVFKRGDDHDIVALLVPAKLVDKGLRPVLLAKMIVSCLQRLLTRKL